jgi:hypothetical protein
MCSRIGIRAQGCGYTCSRMCIVCVRGCDVFEDWYMCSGMWVYVLRDVMCSRIGICAQGCDVFEDWYMCSGM